MRLDVKALEVLDPSRFCLLVVKLRSPSARCIAESGKVPRLYGVLPIGRELTQRSSCCVDTKGLSDLSPSIQNRNNYQPNRPQRLLVGNIATGVSCIRLLAGVEAGLVGAKTI